MSPSNNDSVLSSMEEGRSTINIMGKDGGGHDQAQSSRPMSRQPSNKKGEILKKKVKSLEDAIGEVRDDDQHYKPKIQKVSYLLRRDDKDYMEKYYEPRMVSIGPLHHYKDKVKPAEKFKLKLAALFMQENCILDEDCLYNNIMGQIQDLKKCYFEEDIKGIDDEDLAWMFLVDGCALLLYIHADVEGKLKDLKIKMDMQAFAQQDFFLLENQLPYQILDELIKGTANDGTEIRESIDKFIDGIARQIRGSPERKNDITALTSTQPAHLLELLWRRLMMYNERPYFLKRLRRHFKARLRRPAELHRLPAESQKVKYKRYSFHNVNELKAAWITFKSDTEGSIADISFTSHWFTGTLRVPSLVVDDSTTPKLLNLIAFEMCPDFNNDFQVTSYIYFLDSLIEQPDDVKELRKVGVLENTQGSDDYVAKLFNRIGTNLVPNAETYSTVKGEIQKHYKLQKWKTWMAEAYRDHFSSPLTLLALAGATAALVLSFIQTWYTVYPAK